ncbi:hypothetical protein MmTuc01_1967 [Methanosarcina mazei Tuc01]|nr:hypothetical protein MmTuc01_1967 [Methanosarcina mazei Tuc01]
MHHFLFYPAFISYSSSITEACMSVITSGFFECPCPENAE